VSKLILKSSPGKITSTTKELFWNNDRFSFKVKKSWKGVGPPLQMLLRQGREREGGGKQRVRKKERRKKKATYKQAAWQQDTISLESF